MINLNFVILGGIVILAGLRIHGQPSMENVQIQVQRTAEGLYVLKGRDGNMGLSVVDNGVFLVDDQLVPPDR